VFAPDEKQFWTANQALYLDLFLGFVGLGKSNETQQQQKLFL